MIIKKLIWQIARTEQVIEFTTIMRIIHIKVKLNREMQRIEVY